MLYVMDTAGPRPAVTSIDELRGRYREPSERSANKVRHEIDAASARFLAASPLVLLATSGADGRCDVSPRGGPPGFVVALDERHVAVPDLGGNNRLDSFANIVANPHAGLLFVVPGRPETVRINGAAVLTDDAAVLDRFTEELRRPKLAVVVTTDELYVHCAKAFLRAQVWEPDTWTPEAAPDLPEIYACQFPDKFDAEVLRADLDAGNIAGLAADRPD